MIQLPGCITKFMHAMACSDKNEKSSCKGTIFSRLLQVQSGCPVLLTVVLYLSVLAIHSQLDTDLSSSTPPQGLVLCFGHNRLALRTLYSFFHLNLFFHLFFHFWHCIYFSISSVDSGAAWSSPSSPGHAGVGLDSARAPTEVLASP